MVHTELMTGPDEPLPIEIKVILLPGASTHFAEKLCSFARRGLRLCTKLRAQVLQVADKRIDLNDLQSQCCILACFLVQRITCPSEANADTNVASAEHNTYGT